MLSIKLFRIFIIASLFIIGCTNKENPPGAMTNIKMVDSSSILSKQILQTFALPYSEDMEFDSSSLVFYRSSSYDTSFLLQIKNHDSLIKVVYYEILPEYHRFQTDYADKHAQLIFFQGSSFIIDSNTWKSITGQAKIVFNHKNDKVQNGGYTDNADYALFYEGMYMHGDNNNRIPFEKFYSFVRVQFLDRYLQLRKPMIIYKK